MSINATESQFHQIPRTNIESAVEQNMETELTAILLRMLSEAPGYAQDIALSLKLSPETVQGEMMKLTAQGLVFQVTDSDGNWFRLLNRHVEEAVNAES